MFLTNYGVLRAFSTESICCL